MLLTMMASTGTMWGQTTYKLQQVTSVEAGGLYVFEQDGYVMNNTVSSSALQTTNSYQTSGLNGTETYVWTLETASNGFYMKNVYLTSNQYINNASSTGMSFGSKNSIWAFNFQTDNTVLIQNNSNSDRFLGYTNATSHVYKAYATSNISSYPHAIKVYQLVEETGTLTCATPVFSPVAGTYYEAQSVTITSATDGATIYYTLNGNDPTTSSPVYSSAISITETTTVKAMAVKADYNNSEIASATYTINEPSGETWSLVTSASDLTTGGTYVIACNTQNMVAGDISNSVMQNKSATFSSDKTKILVVPEDAALLTLGIDGSNYTFANSSNNLLGCTEVKKLAWDDGTTTWSISFANNKMTMSSTTSSYGDMKYNSSSPRFTTYASGQTDIQLYRLEGGTITYSVTYDGNGNTGGAVPTDGTAYESGDVVTVLGNTGNLVKAGYIWAGWNTLASGEGTTYLANETFNISANTTLYAKWEAKSITNLTYTGAPTKTEYYSGESFDPTGLTVTATFNDDSSEDVTALVVWTPNPLTTGTTSVTGTYMGLTVNIGSLVVTDAPGTLNNPYTVAQAITAIDAGTGTQGVYATGIISEIVTEYNSQYHNISFNMVDESGDEVFLQAYRCGGDEAANVTVGYIAVVYGNLTYYSSTSLYEFGSGCQIVSLTPPPTPYITANNVEITYDATFGEIEFTINNPVAGGYLEPSTTETWLSFGNVEGNIANFVCDANDGTQRVAQVVLTYHYGTESVTKNITVTQAGNPDVVDHIEDITEAGEYTIQGTIVAKSTRGFVLGDGTGYIYYYKGSEPTQSVGDIVRIVGEVSAPTNYKVFQYTSSATISSATSSEYVPTEPVPTSGADMDGTVGGDGVYQTDYVQYVGTLSVSGTYYNITNIDGATTAIGSISYPTNTDFTSLDGKQVTVTGYYVGVSSNKYFNTMLGSIEEVVGEPSITLAQYTYDINADGGNNELPVTYTNMPANPHAEVIFYDATGTTATTYGWITATINANNNIDGNIAVNEGEARSAYFKVKGIDADNNAVYSDLVTINQAAAAAGPSIVFTTTSIDIIAGGENRTMSFDYEGLGTSPTFSVNFYTATGEPTTYDWISGEITDGDKVTITVDANTGAARTAYFKVYGANGDVNTESNLVTVNQAAGSTPTPGNWVLTDLADLTASDVFVIVGTYTVDNSSYAMSNDNGTANPPAAVEVTVSGNTLSGDIAENIQWNISGDATNGYTFYPNGDATTWLYITSSNAKCSVGTNAAKTFVLDAETGYLKHVGTSKYIGIYNSTDWRGYNPLHANIEGETFAFYKKVDGPVTPSITASDITNISYTTQGVSSPVTVNNYVDGGQLGGSSESDWIEDISVPGEGGSYTLTFNVTENATGAARTATLTLTYFYFDDVANDYAEVSTDISVTQEAAPQNYNLTVEPYENLEIITFVDEEMVLEGDGTVQVASGAEVMLYIVADEGYVIATLMVNGVDRTNDIDGENHYSFEMPGENVTINATAVEYIPPVGGDYVRITSLDQLTDGSKVIIAARYDDEHTDGYYAMPNQTSGKPTGVQFTSSASGDDEILPATIVVDEDDYYWTVNETEHGYTFTNANGDMIGYSSSTNFATGGANTEWSIELSDSEGAAMVPNYTGFLITNVNNQVRHFALNSSHNFGPYHDNNMNTNSYNFCLDFFVQGSTPITTPTITVDPDLVEAPAAGEDSSLGLEYENLEITSADDFGIQFYDEEEQIGRAHV